MIMVYLGNDARVPIDLFRNQPWMTGTDRIISPGLESPPQNDSIYNQLSTEVHPLHTCMICGFSIKSLCYAINVWQHQTFGSFEKWYTFSRDMAIFIFSHFVLPRLSLCQRKHTFGKFIG